ncbi:glycoside hydrolase superfamily [Dioszegia hungarica]|uniref:Glycoside hydrolase superfamily n=1 Tax=Dioszegia hungarica TaxID=4972 RepID=A0AA38HE58_9TREE|nr:glycoside hydrolase superfamily [Dioszegia hungarica]KAI9638540.1 glycoside hydrolase superfamily [Dioszegia hungarica]
MLVDAKIGADMTARNWWRQACVYQIYPRSFYDANGDGIGDLKGITAKVPYLAELGVDAVWLSPFYPSALKDGGYDVADYRDVDPRIGTLADFDEMMSAFKANGIKIIVDIVPNHSSDEHVWFQEALKSPKGSNARSRYIFRDGLGPDHSLPPTDWQSNFGGPAWEPVGDGQFYLHIFDTSQPDFNWEHPEVRADFLKTLRFWADRGVSGYRVDVAHGLAKDLEFPMSHKDQHALHLEKLHDGKANKIHPLWDRDEVLNIYKEWRKVFDEYDPPLTAVAEAWVASDRKRLYASSEGLGQSFAFDMLMCPFKRDDFKDKIDRSLADVRESGSSTTWVFSNHDVIRHATRYGLPQEIAPGDDTELLHYYPKFLLSGGKDPACDLALGLRRARAATLMMLALPGSAYIYQGEELGLPEVPDIPAASRQDPTFYRTSGREIGRDGCRVPLPWLASAPNFGFGPADGKDAHLPQPAWMGDYAVDAEEQRQGSTLGMYRKALKLRRELQTKEDMEWIVNEKEVLHFKREGGWEVIMNFEGEGVDVPEGAEVLVCSGAEGLGEGGEVPKNTAVWFRR